MGINSRGALTARAGVAITQSVGLMDLEAHAVASPSRTMTTTTSPTTAGNMEGGAICTGADSVTRNTRHAAPPSSTQKGISTTEVEEEGNLCPPPPPRGRDSRKWDSPPLPTHKALKACTSTMEVGGEANLLFPPLPPCGRECKRVGYRLRPIRKASRASMGSPPLRAR